MSRKFPFCLRALALLMVALCLCACSKKQLPYHDAVEVKLKCRELADQMLATMPNAALEGFVAMPTSFVDRNDTNRSSALGRLISEAMFYEFNHRGFPTREYRLTGNIATVGGRDDLALYANHLDSNTKNKWAAILVGTYVVDKDATFVHARLVRARDGLVMRTGQLVLDNTPIVRRLSEPEFWVGTGTIPIEQAGTKSRRRARRK